MVSWFKFSWMRWSVLLLILSFAKAWAQPESKPLRLWADTILYLKGSTFEGYGYSGYEPLPVKVWYSQTTSIASKESTLNDMLVPSFPAPLRGLEAAMREALHAKVVEEFLSIDCDGNAIPGFHTDFLDQVLNFPTGFGSAPFLTSTNRPVVIYHHGAQGFPEENLELIRLLVHEGFVVLSANFQMPYPGLPFGSKPWQGQVPPNPLQGLAALLDFGHTLTTNGVFVIGHSWGAQNGWMLLPGTELVKAFVSLETTLEFKEDSASIQTFWPELYAHLFEDKVVLNVPVLAAAGTEKDKPFVWFSSEAPQLLCASTKSRFDHNAFLSAYYWRLNLSFPQGDSDLLLHQRSIYQELNELIVHFLHEESPAAKLKRDRPGSNFYFN